MTENQMNISVSGGNVFIGDHMTVNLTPTGISSEVKSSNSAKDGKIRASNWRKADFEYFQRSELDDQLERLQKGVPIILHGSIGVGKSSAAFNHLVVNKNKYDISWFVDLRNSDSERVVESFTILAKEFASNMSYKELLASIEKRAEELNVIFLLDNLESENIEEEWLDDLLNIRDSIHILITTNNRVLNHPLWNYSEKTEVDRFHRGIEFFKELEDDREMKRRLCDYFSWNILGLTASKDYIVKNKISIDKYLAMQEHKEAAKKIRDKEQNKKRKHLYIAVQTCLEQIDDKFFPVIAAVAFLANNGIPEFLLSSQLPSNDLHINTTEMDDLCDNVKSLIQMTREGDVRLFSFHSFTQLVISDMVDEKESIKSEVLYKLAGVFMKNISKDNRFSKNDCQQRIVRKHAEIFLNKWRNKKKDDRTMMALARLAELIGFTYTQEQPPLLQKLDIFFETSRDLLHELCGVTEDDLQPAEPTFWEESVDRKEIYSITHSTSCVAKKLMKKMKEKSSQIPCIESIIRDLVYCRTLHAQDLDLFPEELKNDKRLKEIIKFSQPLSPDVVFDLEKHRVAISIETYCPLFLAELYVSLIHSYGRNYFYHNRKTLNNPSFYIDLMKLAYCLANEISKEMEPGFAVYHGYLTQSNALLYLLVDDYCDNEKKRPKTSEVLKKDLENAVECYKQLSIDQRSFFEMGIVKKTKSDMYSKLFCYDQILKCYKNLLAMPSNSIDYVKSISEDGIRTCIEVTRILEWYESQDNQKEKGSLVRLSRHINAVAELYLKVGDQEESFYQQAIKNFAISAENARKYKMSLYHLEALVGLADVYSRIGRKRFTALMISFRHLKQCKSSKDLREMLQRKEKIMQRIRRIQAVNIGRAVVHLRLKNQGIRI